MMTTIDVRDWIILGLDIASYSEKAIEEQKDAQEILDRILKEAIHGLRTPKPGDVRWLDAGDGGYALMKWSEREALDVLQRFFEALKRSNARVNERHHIAVRAALHIGQIAHWKGQLGDKYAGHAINKCARLLAGMGRQHQGQVICSSEFYSKISTFDPPAVTVRLQDVKDKHGHAHPVYNLQREPGFGVHPDREERHPDFTAR